MRVEESLRGAVFSLLLMWGVASAALAGEADVSRALRTDGPVYFVGQLVPIYEDDAIGLPALEDLEDHPFRIGRTVDGYVAPRVNVRTISFHLSHLTAAPTQRFYGSGLRSINEQILEWLKRRGLHGVRVRPHPDDIEPRTNRDLRARQEDRLRLLITRTTPPAAPRVESGPPKDIRPLVGEDVRPLARDGDERSFRIHSLESDGPVYKINGIQAGYAEHHEDHPGLRDLHWISLRLGRTADGYIAPRPGVRTIRFTLSQLSAAPPQPIYASGLRSINEQIVAWLNSQGLTAVLVRPHEEDIEPTSGEDLRAEGNTELRLLVWTGRVKELRTFASGYRVDPDERVNHESHADIRDRSPVKPGSVRGMDLIRMSALDDYVARLNRHPGRRIDVALSPGREPGGVLLDYLITETKPWSAYAQWSDTGTDQTTKSRQRFGFSHTQLTGRDDILRLDYVTGDFDDVHAVAGSYEAPLGSSRRTRGRLRASFADFDASVFGFPNRRFEGRQWRIGGELIHNVFQRKELFVDLIAGLRFQNIEVQNPFAIEDAEDSFILPSVGAQLERKTQTTNLYASAVLELNDESLSGNDAADLSATGGLGRVLPDEDWTVLRWNSAWSGYLEPLLNRAAWQDPSTPGSSTLAHEVALLFRGQYAFGNRLIPQEQAIAGGFYSVRGYDQAATAGDSVFIGSAEYRFHVPRALGLRDEALDLPLFGDFRIAPQRVYGHPDWDLILRLFIDGARVENSDRGFAEKNHTLLSAGFGAELQLWRNVVGRFDLGFALRESASLGVERGDNEAHFSVMTLY